MKISLKTFSIFLFTSALVACGGGGSDTPPPPPVVLDADNDGIPDAQDAFPNDRSESIDTDSDGIGNNADTDDDNDNVTDDNDAFPLNAAEQFDTDEDGIGNNADSDDDGDGVNDDIDAFPLNGLESQDTDSDGVGDNSDAFPDDANESADTDSDGVGDNADAFPNDSSETLDFDMDGVGNNSDSDDDGDGVSDAEDAFPLDETETIDTDLDGTGNNADDDDDGDGVLDTDDAFPLDASETSDSDNDGIGDNVDAYVEDAACSKENDGNGEQCYLSLLKDKDIETFGIANNQVVIVDFEDLESSTVLHNANVYIFDSLSGSLQNSFTVESVNRLFSYWDDSSVFITAENNVLFSVDDTGIKTMLSEIENPIRTVIDVDSHLVVADNNWLHTIIDTEGSVTDSQSFWYGNSRYYAWDTLNSRLVYFSNGISPADYYVIYIDESSGTFGNQVESPYHGDYSIRGPIVPSPFANDLLLGAGDIYDSESLIWKGALGEVFIAAYWLADSEIVYLTTPSLPPSETTLSTHQLTRFDFDKGVSEQLNLSGEFIGLIKHEDDATIVLKNNSQVVLHHYTADDDVDNDGTDNFDDAFPSDPAASLDTDGDFYPDEWNEGYTQEDSTTELLLDAFAQDSACWLSEHGADGVCDPTATMPIFIPDLITVGSDSNAFIYNADNSTVYRWHPDTGYQNPIIVGSRIGNTHTAPTNISYSMSHSRLYLAYANGRITYLDLEAGGREKFFTALSSTVNSLGDAGDFIVAASGAWNSHYVFDKEANLTATRDWNSIFSRSVWNQTFGRFFYSFDAFSSSAIAYEDIDQTTGVITQQTELRLANNRDFFLSSDDSKLIFGSGSVFDAESLALVNQQSSNLFDYREAYGTANQLLTIPRGDSIVQLVDLEAGLNLASFDIDSSTALKVIPHNGDAVVLSTSDTGFTFDLIEIVDSDADEMPGWWENLHGLDDNDSSDGVTDNDEDGLSNAEEFITNTDPNNSDSDDDGVTDGDEVNTWASDPNVVDSDGDGLSDGQEINEYNTMALSIDSDEDGISDYREVIELESNPLSSDSDNDGLPDSWEDTFNLDLISDDSQLDADDDGLSNADEFVVGTSPINPDTDADGLNDGLEVNTYETDPLFVDSDGDRVFDGFEVEYSLDPKDAGDALLDSDADGYANFEEFFLGSNPEDINDIPAIRHWVNRSANRQNQGFLPVLVSSASPSLRWNVDDGSGVTGFEEVVSDEQGFYAKTRTGVELLDISNGETIWNYATTNGFSSRTPMLSDDRIHLYGYFPSELRTLNKATGQLIYLSEDFFYNGEINSIPYDENYVYLHGRDSEMKAIDLNGQVAWTSNGLNALNPSGFLLHKDSVIVFDQQRLHRVSTVDGEVLSTVYSSELEASTSNLVITGSYGDLLTIQSFGFGDTRLSSVDIDTGINKWEVSLPRLSISFKTIASAYGRVFILDEGRIKVFNELTGDLVSTIVSPDTTRIDSNLVISRNAVMFSTQQNTYAVEIESSSVLWDIDKIGTLSLSQHGALVISGIDGVSVYNIDVDSDDDGLPNWWENYHGYDINSDDSQLDLDVDGLTTIEEFNNNTSPNAVDSDEDGIDDGLEVNLHQTEPLLADTDGDGLSDGEEINVYLSNPLLADTDNDGFPDAFEVNNTLDPLDGNDALLDNDSDGFTNLEEFFFDSNINDTESSPVFSTWNHSGANARNSGAVFSTISQIDAEAIWSFDSGRASLFESDVKSLNGVVSLFKQNNGNYIWTRLNSLTGALIEENEITGNSETTLSYFDGKIALVDGSSDIRGLNFYSSTNFELLSTVEVDVFSNDYRLHNVNDEYLLLQTRSNQLGVYHLDTNSLSFYTFHQIGQIYSLAATNSGVAYGCTDSGLIQIDLTTGEHEFFDERDAQSRINCTNSSSIVVGSYNNLLTSNGLQVSNINLTTNTVTWQKSDISSNNIATVNGKVFAYRRGNLIAIDETTGDTLWTADESEYLETNIVVTQNKVVVGSFSTTTVIDIENPDERVNLGVGGIISLSDGLLFITSNRNVYAYRMFGDRDGDGLPNYWEQRFGLDPNDASDALVDTDVDGLSNLEELENNANPLLSDTDGDGLEDADEVNVHSTFAYLEDSDGDNVTDSDEISIYETNPSMFDTDEDGFNDWDELFLYNTDPNDSDSLPTAIEDFNYTFEESDEMPLLLTENEDSIASWFATSEDAYSGESSFRAGQIDHSQNSDVVIDALLADGTINFWAKVDSESCCDRLEVYLDGERLFNISSQSWTEYSIPISSGEREIIWRYRKDSSVSRGADTAYIDEISFSR